MLWWGIGKIYFLLLLGWDRFTTYFTSDLYVFKGVGFGFVMFGLLVMIDTGWYDWEMPFVGCCWGMMENRGVCGEEF